MKVKLLNTGGYPSLSQVVVVGKVVTARRSTELDGGNGIYITLESLNDAGAEFSPEVLDLVAGELFFFTSEVEIIEE